MSWKNVRLGDCVDIRKGKKHEEKPFSNSSKRYIQIEDLSTNENLKFTNEVGVEVSENDVIIAWDGANAGKVGTGLNGIIGSTLARLSIRRADLNSRYFFRYLDSNFEHIKSQRTGATIPHVSGSALKSLQIPLPNLPTQQHIAAVLDKTDVLRQQNRQLLAHYDELLQGTFIALFGDPVTNEMGWETHECRNLISNIDAGNSYGGEDREMNDDELGVLKVSAVTSGYFKPNEYKSVSKSILKSDLVFPKKGDLLFSRANTRELVAATCIVDKDYSNIFLPDKLWKLSLHKAKCSQYYFKYILSQNEIRKGLTKTATGTSGSMLNISMEKLKQFEIPLPPLSLQNHFAEIVEKIEVQKEQTRVALAESEALFEGLLAGYFGENQSHTKGSNPGPPASQLRLF